MLEEREEETHIVLVVIADGLVVDITFNQFLTRIEMHSQPHLDHLIFHQTAEEEVVV